MKLGLAQINLTVGDLAGNVDRCERAVRDAAARGAELVVLPEMAIPGYPPRDMLLDDSFIDAIQHATADLAARVADGPPVLVGTVQRGVPARPAHPGLWNVAALLRGGAVESLVVKRLLPVYDVFYEPRWFLPGPPSTPLDIAGTKVGVLVCEDLWDADYGQDLATPLIEAGAELIVVPAASPYRTGIQALRLAHALEISVPVAHVSVVGATDELIFDGQSFVTDGRGRLLAELPLLEESVRVVDTASSKAIAPREPDVDAERYSALVLGLREFAAKNGLEHAVVGLSGGIDSSVVAVLAAAALGGDRVTGVAMPSRYSDPRSTTTAEALAANLGMHFAVRPIDDLHAAAEASLSGLLGDGTAAENVQARLRMLILMAYVNRLGGFLLNTSNKTELAVGYSTLYGDMAGAIGPLADLTKPEVYALARWINREREIIPAFAIDRPPSAELKADQVDPFDYDLAGPAIEALVQADQANPMMRAAEHKRWQFGVVLRLSKRAFGTGRIVPITRR